MSERLVNVKSFFCQLRETVYSTVSHHKKRLRLKPIPSTTTDSCVAKFFHPEHNTQLEWPKSWRACARACAYVCITDYM